MTTPPRETDRLPKIGYSTASSSAVQPDAMFLEYELAIFWIGTQLRRRQISTPTTPAM